MAEVHGLFRSCSGSLHSVLSGFRNFAIGMSFAKTAFSEMNCLADIVLLGSERFHWV